MKQTMNVIISLFTL